MCQLEKKESKEISSNRQNKSKLSRKLLLKLRFQEKESNKLLNKFNSLLPDKFQKKLLLKLVFLLDLRQK